MNRAHTINRSRTAIGRLTLSRPIRLAMDAQLITQQSSVLDYGCGRGDDVRLLTQLGVRSTGWDPEHHPWTHLAPADIVNLGYVVNVIEDQKERANALRTAWKLARKLLIVAARLRFDASGCCDPFGDGVVTARNTFQKFFTQQELRTWIENTIGAAATAAGPGVFFVFRDENLRESYLDARYRRQRRAPTIRKSDLLFEKHRDVLNSLMAFLTEAGRLPAEWELPEARQISEAFGSLRRAFSVVRRVTAAEQWEQIRAERRSEILSYLALAKFEGRLRYGQLPPRLQLDIREFFRSYRDACEEADKILFSAGDMRLVRQAARRASVGKRTPTAIYVHTTGLHQLPILLRVYEGCARTYLGLVKGTNVVKLHLREPAVSYLWYPSFDTDPHPALAGTMCVGLRTLRVRFRDYTRSQSPPVLHRKEQFVPEGHPLREKFARLTRKEELAGLFESPARIGTRRTWNELLRQKGLCLRGHRLLRST